VLSAQSPFLEHSQAERKNNMQEAIYILQSNPYFEYATTVIALASLVCAVTPTPKKGSSMAKVYKAIEVLALNIWKAKK